MLQLRKWLTARSDWFETCLQQLAALDGYGDIPRPLIQLFAHIGREPVRLVEIANRMGTSRQWVLRLANQGRDMGMLELNPDPTDKRAITLQFSETGWHVVRLAVARMDQIETELASRIGAENLQTLVELLSTDWGPAEIPVAPQRAASKRKTSRKRSSTTPLP